MTEVQAAEADPLLALIAEYRAALDAYHSADAEDDAADEVARAPMMALWRRLVDECPVPTTMEGAIEGVRLVEEDLRSNGFGSFHTSVLAVAVAYFDGGGADATQPVTDEFEPFSAAILGALPSAEEFSRKQLVTVRFAAAVTMRTKAELVQAFAEEPDAMMDFHQAGEGTAAFLRSLADLCEIAAARVLLAGKDHVEASDNAS